MQKDELKAKQRCEPNMFNSRPVILQNARSSQWVRLIIAVVMAGFAILFIPFTHENALLWFIMLFFLSYVLIFYTMGFRSWITKDSEGKYTLCIRDNYSRTNAYIPFGDITHVETCHYSLFGTSAPPAYKNQDLHRIYKHFGYQGMGIIVCYKLPRYRSEDSARRSWQFPAPKADQFLNLLQDNLPNDATEQF